ncbi:hypothetical protein [Alkalisalibacterium limincola]|uniref:Ig-like domain-containing protein n=1 Tax=Alkalisalibacterium limincola TaxID=2699169 RepID=A0A5C8KZ14_9GAMM|nr:hypothetical protein [Alkalisalibacterium limincola]TXK64525.1 hypothetical protein FU658_06515 [Alkalisalibacterium limincola]
MKAYVTTAAGGDRDGDRMKNGSRRVRARAFGWAALAALAPGVAAATDVAIYPERVELTFDQPMATWHYQGSSGVELEPEVPFERCVWYSDTELACEFEDGQPARNATSYLVHVPEFATQEGGVVQARIVGADTPRPVLSAPHFLIEWSGETPRLHIRANQDVSATAVAQVLELTVDGQPIPVVLRPGERQGWIPAAFTLDLPQDVPRLGMLELSVAPGLVGEEGPLPGVQEEVLLRARLGEEPRAVTVACTPDRQVAVDAQAGATVRCRRASSG